MSEYARAGVDTSRAEQAVAGLVDVLRHIDPGRPSRAVLGSGHYANVLRIDDRVGIALSTDGVGSKVIVAEQLGRFDTVGIDCIAVIGLPSSGVRSNGLTLARHALPDLHERPAELGGRSVGEVLLEPTIVYVRAVLELLGSGVDVRGLAHITSGGLLNLLRLEADVGYSVDPPLSRLPIFDLIAARSRADEAELAEVFNMGCGFCCVVPADQVDAGVELLDSHHPGTDVIGTVTADAGVVEVPPLGLRGDARGFRAGGGG